jgi:phosphomannomutase
MIERQAMLGGEESGGYGFQDHIPERDAILAGLYLLDLCVHKQKPLSAIVHELHEVAGPSYYHRDDVHFAPDQRGAIRKRVDQARPKEIAGLKVERTDDKDGRKYYPEDGSWLLVRFSGTEPLLRIYTETTRPERVQQILAAGHQITGV